jgi:hypothetical protein
LARIETPQLVPTETEGGLGFLLLAITAPFTLGLHRLDDSVGAARGNELQIEEVSSLPFKNRLQNWTPGRPQRSLALIGACDRISCRSPDGSGKTSRCHRSP